MNLKPARVLGIETSCDETAASVVENGREILSSVVATQIDLHVKYGGVFPEVASRQHIRTIYAVIEEALQRANLSLNNIEAIAVTRGPGLAGSLVVGMNAAKGLALGKQIPLIGINHLEGHIYSAWLYPADTPKPPPPPEFPQMVLLVSGTVSFIPVCMRLLTAAIAGVRIPFRKSSDKNTASVYFGIVSNIIAYGLYIFEKAWL